MPLEREILAPIDIAHPDGRLMREAVGWARHPIHRVNLARGLSRVWRWNYWCFTTSAHALTVLVADVGFAGAALVSFLDYAARAPVERLYVRPLGLPLTMPDATRGDIVLEARGLRLAMRDRDEQLLVEGEARTIFGRRIALDLVVERPRSHETLNVLVPFDDTSFQLTSKQQALPVRGIARVDGRDHRFGPENEAFACFDYGRGRWPRGIEWNWCFASGVRAGRTLGMNFGAKWTDGTGVTENGVVIDGRLHKVSEGVDFACDLRRPASPWRILARGPEPRVDLRFVPIRERVVRVPLGIASATLHQRMGAFSGTIVDDAGAHVSIVDMVGLAESFRARW